MKFPLNVVEASNNIRRQTSESIVLSPQAGVGDLITTISFFFMVFSKKNKSTLVLEDRED